ncbi:Hypothetical protein FKW44_011013 [Caligus rogercresseyi]|uniref:Uncharacterized protein n=1 Tax=Caligus rogercresseyi TaxID=217165 RepID=A0A7T8HHF1_CALRO|nr:Hypothetical protein FKW44_011013 [Caligus rogercresseyi]
MQSSVLGHLLFIILTADLPNYLRSAVNPEAHLKYCYTPKILSSTFRLHPGQVDFAMGAVSRPWRRIQIPADST